jgi:ABC-type glycerol-3-phosphate transport system substrate-binding protein
MKTSMRLTLASAALALLVATPALAQTRLNMYLSQFYAPEVYPELSAATQALIDEYQAQHPDVRIEISPYIADVNAYQAWLTTRFAAGDQPDIAWQQFYQRNAERGQNWLALNDYP